MESIRFKLWSTIIVLVLLILIPIWYFQVIRLEQSYLEARFKDAENATMSIHETIKEYGQGDKSSKVMSSIANEDEICVLLFDENGSPVHDYTMADIGCVYDKLVEEQQYEILSSIKELKYPIIQFDTSNQSALDYPAAIYGSYIEATRGKYLLVVSTYVTPVGRVLEVLKSQLMMLTLPLLIAASIIAFFIARSFSRPIMKLSNAAKEIAKGNYDTRVEEENDDEIGILQQNFNYMGEQICQLEELRRDLIANVSHDLKTPLTMIRGYAETIKDLTGDYKEKREQQLDIIIEESDRLNALVNDMLNLSRFQSGQITLERVVFDLNEMILNTLQQYDLLITNQGYTINYEPQGPCFVYADILRMKQVLYNILNNAVNHTGEDKKIDIRLFLKNERYRVEIKDTGMGIAKEDLIRIWDRYYKIDKSGKRRVAGTGIGLAIVKSILSAHETLFGVESEYGHGATFWFELEKVEHFKKAETIVVSEEQKKIEHEEENV
ncbi:MAG: HAMP domain-containing protein [Erysipelotrichales bacterium]|nr:HAMP domain-containing protein [Erysipelotrichales bacterium]